MFRPAVTALALFTAFGISPMEAQPNVTFKNFNSFRQMVPGIDFFASNRKNVTPYEKPATEVISRLKKLLGNNLPKGAVFVCSNLAQKDSVYEPKVLRNGYNWTITAITPEVRSQEILARIKSQMGGDIPAEILDRMKNRMPEMAAQAEQQIVDSTVQEIAYAVLQTTFAEDLRYRSSRLDDMGKSPLPDWLDIGIASYATGKISNLSYLQEHMDETFPLEDVLSMSRPFVASSFNSGGNRGGGMDRSGGGNGRPNFGGMDRSGGGNGRPNFGGMGGMPGGMGGMPGGMGGMPGGRTMGGMPSQGTRGTGGFGGRGQRGERQRVLPKDEQDRMLFDGEASTFFSYLIEKIGIDKIKGLISYVRDGKETREYLVQIGTFGKNYQKIEEVEGDWINWIKAQQPEPESTNRRFN